MWGGGEPRPISKILLKYVSTAELTKPKEMIFFLMNLLPKIKLSAFRKEKGGQIFKRKLSAITDHYYY